MLSRSSLMRNLTHPADVKLNVREFPVLGTVTLRNGDTGELL